MPDDDMKAWRERLGMKAWRERLGMKEVAAAKEMDMPAQTYRNYEDGRRPVPAPIRKLMRYIERFGPLDGESR
jgi:DNA-binding transcriptional regulator YiaG